MRPTEIDDEPADQQQQHGEARPAGVRDASEVDVDEDPGERQARRGHREADVDDPAQQRGGLEEQAVGCDAQQRPERVRAATGESLGVLELDRSAVEAEPIEDQQEVAVSVGTARKALEPSPTSCSGWSARSRGRHRRALAQPEVRTVRDPARPRLPTHATLREDDVVPVERLRIEIGDRLGRILEVAVHDDRPATGACDTPAVIAACWPKFRLSRTALTCVVLCRELEHGAPRSVPAAVVDEHDLPRVDERRERRV